MKTKQKKCIIGFFLFSFILITTQYSYSQEKKKILEISTTTFNQYRIKYKFGNEKHLFRLSTAYINGSSADYSVSDSKNINAGFGVGFGIEYPTYLNEHLILYYGPELRTNFSNSTGDDGRKQYGFGAYGIIGFAWHFNSNIRLGAEVSPGISYDYYNEKNNNNYTTKIIRYGFSNSLAELILGFEF